MERSEEEQGLLSSPCSLLETAHHLLWRGAHGSNPIQCMCTCMRMRPCACLKSVSEATPCSFGCWRNCGVEIKALPAEWCSRGDFTTQPSPLCRGGCLLLTAPLSPLTMYCPLHIPARKKWLRPHLSCVYEWEALRDREWNLQESMKRPSPLPSLSLSRLEDFSFFVYCSLCVWEGHYAVANNVGVCSGPAVPPVFTCLRSSCLFYWTNVYQCLSFISIKS